VSHLILDLASPKSRNIHVDDARVLTETAPNIRSRDSAPKHCPRRLLNPG
jgi:hypothetical protein